MTTCPKCQTKNLNSSRFCKKCGSELSGSSLRSKKKKVLGEKRKSFRSPMLWMAVVIALGGFGYWLIRGNSEPDPRISNQPTISGGLNYARLIVPMTDISSNLENGEISVPLDLVKEKRLVRFEYASASGTIPLLAYITPTGRVMTAVSVCEPCRSTHFTIRDKTVVCNACATEWNIENLKGIRGGCVNYPPDVIPSTVDKGRILIDEKIVARWKPRA
ncbi:MAG: Fe-S-containing protein [Acidobacteriota bacterium]